MVILVSRAHRGYIGPVASLMKFRAEHLLDAGLGVGILCALGVGLASCAPPVVVASAGLGMAQAGTVAYFEGELRTAFPRELEASYAAIEPALKRLGFDSDRAEFRAQEHYGYVFTHTLTAERIEIRVTGVTDRVTALRIRVGVFGDQAVARLILNEIEDELGLDKAKVPDAT